MPADARVRTAHADAWAAEGLLREPLGGAALTLTGIRCMASGLPQPRFNGADVTAAYPDLEGARSFYAERGLPLGVRVPEGMRWSTGNHILDLRLMGLERARFVPAPPVEGVTVREATELDLEAVVALDAEAFDDDPDEARPWLAPHLGAAGVTVAIAEVGGEPAATAYVMVTDGAAGPAVLLAGVAVTEPLRRRGIGAAISSWLLERGFAAGARLGHLQADSDAAARVYARLGFAEAGALGVFVEV